LWIALAEALFAKTAAAAAAAMRGIEYIPQSVPEPAHKPKSP